jgi:D-tagatose-1,6-bisphosphate aldolase subunit GatZ/KbaZ
MSRALPPLLRERLTGGDAGVTSVCSAHPMVIEAALAFGARTGRRVLIEATCNQVNQEGGYTGMTPADFRSFVEAIASRIGFDPSRIALGGDHLGPNPWKTLPATEALTRAEAMVAAYAQAGFEKIHLDASMGCAGEPAGLPDAIAAARAARLAEVAEAAPAPRPIVYVVGTEVPTPGGVGEALEVHVTEPDAVRATLEAHESAFRKRGLEAAFARVIALVVQPAVEFGASDVVRYARPKAQRLSAALTDLPQFVFEAHSTDYQTREALAALVADGFAILKVGPALTFALREALYGLDHIAEALVGLTEGQSLRAVMERVMTGDPRSWAAYYGGGPAEQRLLRHFSLSDRIRYYWTEPQAVLAVDRLLERLQGLSIPPPLAHQYLPGFDLNEDAPVTAPSAIRAAVTRVLADYGAACAPTSGSIPAAQIARATS